MIAGQPPSWQPIAVLQTALIVALMTSSQASPPQTEFKDSFVRVQVIGGFTPYRLCTYDVFWRSRVAVASQYRGLVNYSEALHEMSLVTNKQYRTLMQKVRELGAFELKSKSRARHRMPTLKIRVEVGWQGKKHAFEVVGPSLQKDPRYQQLISLVRGFVVRQTGQIPFRNVFFEPGTFGFLNLTSVPIAKVTIDGRTIHMSTPVYGYELKAGDHKVVLTTKEGYKRTYTLRIEPGMTTVIHFDLR